MTHLIRSSLIAGEALTDEELDWYHAHDMGLAYDPANLTLADAERLWNYWWTLNPGLCDTCGRREGHCTYELCVRLRVTDKIIPMVQE